MEQSLEVGQALQGGVGTAWLSIAGHRPTWMCRPGLCDLSKARPFAAPGWVQ